MKIGPLELQLKETPSGAWKYTVTNTRTGQEETHGFRPSENIARQAGLEDALFIRANR